MAWTTISNFKGKLYIPDYREHGKKHACPDCFACQYCGDDRCTVCAGQRAKPSPAKDDSD